MLIINPMTINIRPQLPRVINKGLNSISILVKIAKIKTLNPEKVEGFTLVVPEGGVSNYFLEYLLFINLIK